MVTRAGPTVTPCASDANLDKTGNPSIRDDLGQSVCSDLKNALRAVYTNQDNWTSLMENCQKNGPLADSQPVVAAVKSDE